MITRIRPRLALLAVIFAGMLLPSIGFSLPTRSTSIALTSNDRWAVVANRQDHTISVVEVRDSEGRDTANLLVEIPVGLDPRYVAISPDDGRVYVSNGQSGTISVVDLGNFTEIEVIAVGAEPRGIALTPNGAYLYVANHTSGSVSVIDTNTLAVILEIDIGGNPMAVTVSDDGDDDDSDEHVFVTNFFSELIPGRRDGFDDAKEGAVYSFPVFNSINEAHFFADRTALPPMLNSGFSADRSALCGDVHSLIFCTPGPVAQGVYPNMLQAAVIRNNKLFLPNTGASPAPPVKFNINVQGLVNVMDTRSLASRADLDVNLNNQIKKETQPTDPTHSLDRLFSNDLVAVDANASGSRLYIVSRGGNYVLVANVDGLGRINIGAPDVTRYLTGNIPTGVVLSADESRLYTNNEVNETITSINLSTGQGINRDISYGDQPVPGTPEHFQLMGKLAFYTALGIPDNGIRPVPVRQVNALNFRGKASDNGWSSCTSCHPDGHTDQVVWIFPTGPRRTIPLDAFFAKNANDDQRLSNWSAVRGSITDFNNNSRNIQGGVGFAGDPPNPAIFNHGITTGASEALDAMTDWVRTVRAFRMPTATDREQWFLGKLEFENHCASCHGGVKWTKSEVFHQDNPAFDGNPLAGGQPFDPGIENAGPQIQSYTFITTRIQLMESVGTFNPEVDPLEIRGAGGGIGRTALGGLGFNVPSLLGVGFHKPYLHNGDAETLDDVFARHTLAFDTIDAELSFEMRRHLKVFLNSIDDRTEPLASEGDQFKAATGL